VFLHADHKRRCESVWHSMAHVGDVIEQGANDVHAVVEADELHRRHNQQGYAQIGAMARLAEGW